MYGERNRSGKNDKLYVTYKCSGRRSNNGCRNKPINRQYIEKFVLLQLKSLLLGSNIVKNVTKNLNVYMSENSGGLLSNIREYERKKKAIETKINNLIRSIENGISAELVADKLDALGKQKILYEGKIGELKQQLDRKKIKVSEVQHAISNYYELMRADELVVRKFIQKYVEKVLVYQDRIEIILLTNRDLS
ncbi:MAG: hypothetical protein J1F63_03895 [Oscillospiraceae bacterium]|nr:hypothetical protein [Oscillospiraceae bacterium]